MAFTVLCTVFAAVSLLSCDNEQVGDQAVTMADTIRIVKGYEYEPALTHKWDSVMKTTVKDFMDSKLEVWSTRDGQRQLPSVYNNTVHPEAVIGSLLARQDYAIKENQVNIKPSSSTIIRDRKLEEDGTTTEIDTVRYWFEDSQIWSIPVKITNNQVKIGSSVFDFPSMTLTGHEFVHLKNTSKSMTRAAQYKSADYQTEYKAMLSFKETNIESPKTMKAPIYAFTGRFVMSDDDLDKVVLADSSRVWVDQTTDKCKATFDLYLKSARTTSSWQSTSSRDVIPTKKLCQTSSTNTSQARLLSGVVKLLVRVVMSSGRFTERRVVRMRISKMELLPTRW